MSWLAEHSFALALFAAYTALMAWHAWQGWRRTHGLADYYVGGRALGGVAIGLSFFATYSSTNSFVGFAGQAYSYGVPWLLLTPAILLFSVLAWTVIAPRLRHFAATLGSLTIPDFIGFRYGSTPARVLAAALVLFASFFYLTAIFKGVGNTLEMFLEVPYPLAIGLFFVIVMSYTAVGGFISVVKTDVVQALIMIAAAVVLFLGVTNAAGGVSSFYAVRELPDGDRLFSWHAAMPFPVLLGIIFAGSIKFLVEPRQLSRFYGLRDRRAVRRGLLVSTAAFLVVYSLLMPLGLYARRILPASVEDTDLVIPTLLTDPAVFHPMVGAFILVALVAAAMSSVDSVLLVMASTCHRDLVSLWRGARSERAAVRESAIWVVLFALITTLLALNPPGPIVTLTAFSGSVYAACFFPALLLGLYWRRGTGTAVLASITLGFATLLLWKPLGGWAGVHEVFPALVVSTCAYLLVSFRSAPVSSGALDGLFDRGSAEKAVADLVGV